jgi:hypothetical protein
MSARATLHEFGFTAGFNRRISILVRNCDLYPIWRAGFFTN